MREVTNRSPIATRLGTAQEKRRLIVCLLTVSASGGDQRVEEQREREASAAADGLLQGIESELDVRGVEHFREAVGHSTNRSPDAKGTGWDE